MILRMSEDGSAYFDGSTSSYKSLIKAIPGNGWDRKHRYWTIPIESLEDAKQMLPTLEIDQEVTQAYAEMKIRNGKAIAVKNGRATGIVNKVKGIKGKLYPYQAQGRAFIDATEDNEGKLLAFDMGLGKSLTSLAAFVDWKRRGIVDYCLVVCPSPLKYSTWEKEVVKWTDLECVIVDGDHRQEVQWDDGTTSKLHGQELRAVQYAQWQYGVPIIVVNYELFLRDMDILPPVDERWLIVLDECFAYDTRIMLEDGSLKQIGDIVDRKLKCQVLSYNISTGKPEAKPIVNWFKHKRKTRMIKLRLDSGAELTMTESHKVYTKNRGYVKARDLKATDEVILCLRK